MKLALASVAAVAAALVAAAPSAAAVQVTTTLNAGAPIVTPPMRSFTVGANFVADSAATALYTFTLGSAQAVTASIFSTDSISDTALNFTSLRLYSGTAATYTPGGASLQATTTTFANPSGGSSIALSPFILNAGTYTVAVVGNASSNVSIGGTISFGAAPEPATWGMMVLGFGAIGAALRTSRRKVVFA